MDYIQTLIICVVTGVLAATCGDTFGVGIGIIMAICSLREY